jgi:20S proteasome alpha/beta subunit
MKKLRLLYHNNIIVKRTKSYIQDYLFSLKFKNVLHIKRDYPYGILRLFIKHNSYYYNIKISGSWTGLSITINGYTLPVKTSSFDDAFKEIMLYLG